MDLLESKLQQAGSTAYLASMSTQLFRTKRREDWSWGCGYRNAQILLSAMASHPDIKDRLALPEMTITHLQETLQGAWKQGRIDTLERGGGGGEEGGVGSLTDLPEHREQDLMWPGPSN